MWLVAAVLEHTASQLCWTSRSSWWTVLLDITVQQLTSMLGVLTLSISSFLWSPSACFAEAASSYNTFLPENFCWILTCGLCPSARRVSPSLPTTPLRPDLPPKLRDPRFSPLPHPSLLVIPPFVSFRLTGSSSFSGSDISPLPCNLCLLP